MKESMFDILVYLFENYFDAEEFRSPDQDALALKLSAAGFESEEINKALDWLTGLESLPALEYSFHEGQYGGIRIYAEPEARKLNAECRGFLSFLEVSGILGPMQREWVIDRILALNEDDITLEKLKWTVLIVLWSQGQAKDYLFLEELLFGDSSYQLH